VPSESADTRAAADTRASAEVDDVMSRMTLQTKVGQLFGTPMPPNQGGRKVLVSWETAGLNFIGIVLA